MSATIERPQTAPDLSADEMGRLRTVRDRQNPQPPLTVVDALTFERFWAWLETKPDGEMVGRARSTTSCPIHTYLFETFRGRYSRFEVGSHVRYAPCRKPSDSRVEVLPLWGVSFVHHIDKRAGPVLAYQVRAVLRDMSILRR